MNMSEAHNNATLKANNISKTYSGREVVSDVSFYVNPGEVVGLLGPIYSQFLQLLRRKIH